ncbi:MAG TPA: glucose dehydrogenase, partial [Blastocatellia bacterium]|nr:glucose dehydrogenase [Blastocatellia bacterium]
MTKSIVALVGLVLIMSFASSNSPTAGARAQTAAPQVALVPVLSGLASPVYFTNAHDGTNRRFIVEQGGRIKVLANGASTPTVFLDIAARVIAGGEQGLLGLAFHPHFRTNRRFFV